MSIVTNAVIVVSLMRMRLSDNTTDYFVHINYNGRTTTPHMFKDRYKAEYEVAHWKHIFFGEPEPDLMAFDEESYPND